MSSTPCRKWCVLCLHDGAEHELLDVFSVNDLCERVAEEYDIHIKEGDVSSKICIQCFQETLTFRKQRKSYEADKERVLKNQKQLESQLVAGGRETTNSSGILGEALKSNQNVRNEKGSTPSQKKSSSKKGISLSIGTKKSDGVSSGSKQNSSQKIKSKEKTNSTSGSTNTEKNTASKHSSGNDPSDSQKRNNGSMKNDGPATSGPNSKSLVENKKRVRFSINDDTYRNCTPPPKKKLKFSESAEKSDASSKNQEAQKSRDKKPPNNREQSDLQPPKGSESKKGEAKNRTASVSGQSVESADKTVTKPTSTPSRQPSELPGNDSKKESSKKSTISYSGLKIKLQIGKQKTYPPSSDKRSSKSSSNATKKNRPDTSTTNVSTPVNVGSSVSPSTQAKSTLEPIISGPVRSVDVVPETSKLLPVPGTSTPSVIVPNGQIQPRTNNDPCSGQLQPVPIANTSKVAVPIGLIQTSSSKNFTSGEGQLNSTSVANTPPVVVPIVQIQPRLPSDPVASGTQLRQITVVNTGAVLVPIGQLQTSNTVTSVSVSSRFNSTSAGGNIYTNATSSVNASDPPPLTDLNQNISRGSVSAPLLVSKPTTISLTSAETNPSGSLALTSDRPWQPSNVPSITSCPIVTTTSGQFEQRSNVTFTTTALPMTMVPSSVVPLTTVVPPAVPIITVASSVVPLTSVASSVVPLTTVAPPVCQGTTSVISVSSHQETTTTTSVAPSANTDGQSSNVGIKKRRHSTFIRVSTNLFDEPDAQFASLRNNLFVRNNEQPTTSFQKSPLVLNSYLLSTATAPGQTNLPIRMQANNSHQPGVPAGALPFSHVSSKLQPTPAIAQDEARIPVHILYKPGVNNGPQSTISARVVAQNQNPPIPPNVGLMRPAIHSAGASSGNIGPTYTGIPLSGSTRTVQIVPRMPTSTQTSTANAATSRYYITTKQGTTGNTVNTTNNVANVLPTGVRTSTVTTNNVNTFVRNTPNVNCVTNPPQQRPILMCQLCAEFFLTEPLMGQHLNQVHFVEFSRSLFSTVYDESIRKLLIARARRKSIATPDDLRSER